MVLDALMQKRDKAEVYQTYKVNKWFKARFDHLLKEIYHLDHNQAPIVTEQIVESDREALHDAILDKKLAFRVDTADDPLEHIKAQRDAIVKQGSLHDYKATEITNHGL